MKMNRGVLLAVALAAVAPAASAQGFTGDTKLACEAILCLSSGQRPDECTPSLERYFSIDARRISDLIRKRGDFLKLCPSADDDDTMRSLVDSIANGAGRCDAATLNMATRVRHRFDGTNEVVIRNTLPSYCNAYGSHEYTDQTASTIARYIGVPGEGGRWVDPQNYEAELAKYNEEQAAREAARQAELWNGGARRGETRQPQWSRSAR